MTDDAAVGQLFEAFDAKDEIGIFVDGRREVIAGDTLYIEIGPQLMVCIRRGPRGSSSRCFESDMTVLDLAHPIHGLVWMYDDEMQRVS